MIHYIWSSYQKFAQNYYSKTEYSKTEYSLNYNDYFVSFGGWLLNHNFAVSFLITTKFFLCSQLYSLRSWFRVYGVDKNPDVCKTRKVDFVGCEVDYSGGTDEFREKKK